MSLTVKEAKAGSRPASGYNANFPLSFKSTPLKGPGTLAGGTILRQPVLRSGMRQANQARGTRVTSAQRQFNLLGSRPRTIL